METRQTIFLDLDGVLADFDSLAGSILGTDNIYKWEFVHGPKAFWKHLNDYPEFFRDLPLKSDALELWFAVKQLGMPTILTALPKKGDTEVDRQKREWVSFYLGGDVPVVTCLTSEKPNYCKPGDILIDDRAINREAWVNVGGKYILHTSARTSIFHLTNLMEYPPHG